MNHFSYEVLAKEKAKDLRAEGLRSQALQRSAAPKLDLLHGLPKIGLGLLGILGLLTLLMR